MIETFGAPFLGVILSFLLWYIGTWWIKRQSDKRSRTHILNEIKKEIRLNVTVMDALRQSIPKALADGNIPAALPGRLRLSTYNYAVSSGELRLLSPQCRVNLTTAVDIYESTNRFIENTEMLLAIWHFKPQDQALRLASIRLNGLVESLGEGREELKRILDAL